MLNNEQLHHLNKLSDRLELVQRRIQAYRYNTPLNRQQERARLLEAHRRGDVYNPQFKFRKTPNDWDVPLHKLMRDVRPDNNLWEGLLYRHLQHELARLQSLATHDPQQITAVTLEAHGAISPRLVDLRVTDHLRAHPADYDLLMSGKVSFEMLDWLRQLKAAGQLAPPRYLPHVLRLGKQQPI